MDRTHAERGTIGRRSQHKRPYVAQKNGWDKLDLQIDDLYELLLQILDEGGIAQWRHLRALQDITERERRRSGR